MYWLERGGGGGGGGWGERRKGIKEEQERDVAKYIHKVLLTVHVYLILDNQLFIDDQVPRSKGDLTGKVIATSADLRLTLSTLN